MIKKIKCKVCLKYFEVEGQNYNGFFRASLSPWNLKTCSEECRKKSCLNFAKIQREKKKKIEVKRKCRFCRSEVISTIYCPRSFCDGKVGLCYRSFLSENRKGKKNPSYRNGFAMSGKRTYIGIHLRACSKYRKEFLGKNDYLFCEICGVNTNGTLKFEVHHIYFASLYPKHKELHNPLNLVLVCIKCHNKFHSSRYREEFNKIEEERGLKELFKVL